MRSTSVRSFVLCLVVTSLLSFPAVANVDRDGGDVPIVQRIVNVLRQIVTISGDTISVPKP